VKKFREWFKGLTDTRQVLFVVAILITTLGIGTALTPNTTNTADKKPDTTKQQPKTTTKTVTEEEDIPFDTKKIESSSLSNGESKITTTGVKGTRKLTYKITYEDGKQTNKKLIRNEITKQPVAQVTTIGTYVAPAPKPKPKPQSNCDPNYSGACVPIAYDVDCAGGRGDGPEYVNGPVYVVGSDIYGLDGDGNGVGCQS